MSVTPVGPEFYVNTQTAGTQRTPTVTGLANGGFVVAWADPSGTLGDASGTSIKAKLFDAAGRLVLDEFLVNTQTAGDQNAPSVTGLANGGFVVTWTDTSPFGDGIGTSVKAKIFDAAGAVVRGELAVNSQPAGNQFSPTITALSNGGFVVSWEDTSRTGDASGTGIKARIYDAAGNVVHDEFVVNTQTSGDQFTPTITALSNGGFVVSWSDGGIKAKVFDAAGNVARDEFVVDTPTALSSELDPAVAGLPNGGFVVTWVDAPSGSPETSVKAKIYDAAGALVRDEFVVETQTTGTQNAPAITVLADGGFAIAWHDLSGTLGDGSGSIKAKVFDAAGAVVQDEFLVNTNTGGDQSSSAIADLTNGGFVVSWHTEFSFAGDPAVMDISARIFRPDFPPVNANGGPGPDRQEGGFGHDNLAGNGGDDTALGGFGNDTINGGPGNDYLNGEGDDDTVLGGDGDDTVLGDTGNDYLDGGIGNDLIMGGAGNDTVLGEAGDDYVNGGAGNDLVFGGAGRDTLIGETGNDYLNGEDGNDTVFGGAGTDTVIGGAGDDYLDGGQGDDILAGNDGNDTLFASSGNDYLEGGAGNDVFVFEGSFGHSIVIDLATGAGSGDIVQFKGGVFADFADVTAHAVQDGTNVVITATTGDTLTLANVALANLVADDFRFG